jgi:hypothetical protein
MEELSTEGADYPFPDGLEFGVFDIGPRDIDMSVLKCVLGALSSLLPSSVPNDATGLSMRCQSIAEIGSL